MKKLIVYSSKTGTTEKCAGILGQNLIDATIINLATIQNEDINKYDLIIIGSPIRMGMIDKKVKEFLSKNLIFYEIKWYTILFVVDLMKIGNNIMSKIFQKNSLIML